MEAKSSPLAQQETARRFAKKTYFDNKKREEETFLWDFLQKGFELVRRKTSLNVYIALDAHDILDTFLAPLHSQTPKFSTRSRPRSSPIRTKSSTLRCRRFLWHFSFTSCFAERNLLIRKRARLKIDGIERLSIWPSSTKTSGMRMMAVKAVDKQACLILFFVFNFQTKFQFQIRRSASYDERNSNMVYAFGFDFIHSVWYLLNWIWIQLDGWHSYAMLLWIILNERIADVSLSLPK